MKNLKAVVVFFLLISCGKEEEVVDTHSPVIGKWQLIELYSDPGDGSGEFAEVNSNKTVEFFRDGTVTSNGSLCAVSPRSDAPSSGTFSITDFTIKSSGCASAIYPDLVTFFTLDGEYLLIYQPCIEGCGEKYTRL